MGDVTYYQTATVVAGKTPDSGSIRDKDFEITQEQTVVSDLNEDTYQRFVVEPGMIDMPLCQGTIELIKLMYIKPSSDLLIKLVNPTSGVCEYTLYANRPSTFHMQLIQVTVSNPTSVPIKGTVFFAGD